MKKQSCAVVLLALIGAAAHAQENIYVGIGYGNLSYEENYIDPILGQVSDTAGAWKLIGGFEFNEHIAMEIGYGRSDDFRQSGSANILPFGGIDLDLYADFTTSSLTAVGQLPFEWGVLLGGLGYYRTDADYLQVAFLECCGLDSQAFTVSDDGLAAKLGIEWRFGRFGTRYGIRLEYDWYDVDSVDLNSVGLALTYGF